MTAQILKSLNAATATGAGSAWELVGVSNEFTLVTVPTGSPAACSVNLEGSVDGTNWYSLGVSTSSVNTAAAHSSSTTPLAKYVRAYLGNLSGGSSPAVSAWVVVK